MCQGSASEACLTYAVAAREAALARITKSETGSELEKGSPLSVPAEIRARSTPKLVMYGSTQTHSYIFFDLIIFSSVIFLDLCCSVGAKAALILGLTWRSLPVKKEEEYALRGDVLLAAIEEDVAKGCIPMMVIGTVGTTNTGAIDRVDEIGAVGKSWLFFLHAAEATSADWLERSRSLRDMPVLRRCCLGRCRTSVS